MFKIVIFQASCAIEKTLSDEQFNCRNNGSTDSTLLFWKFNDTLRQDWTSVLTDEYSMTESNIENLFDTSTKTEPAEEYWK